jgi:hypothetical protein
MDTMRHLICGMYGKLQEKEQLHLQAVEAFSLHEKRLRELVETLPNDVITLDSIRQAAATVETIAVQIPNLVRSEINKIGEGVAHKFNSATEKKIASIEHAANLALEAADIYTQSASWSHWKTTGLAIVISSLCVGFAVAGFWLWLPSYNEIQNLRMERDSLQYSVAELEKSGGRLEVSNCGGRICAVVDEKSIQEGWRNTKTNELMVILKRR